MRHIHKIKSAELKAILGYLYWFFEPTGQPLVVPLPYYKLLQANIYGPFPAVPTATLPDV